MKKKILVKAYTKINLGDDLFLAILLDRYPEIEFTLLDSSYISDTQLYSKFNKESLYSFSYRVCRKIASFFFKKNICIIDRYYERYRSKKLSNKYDTILALGGSLYMQSDINISADDTLNKALFNDFKHVYIIGANFGPYHDEKYRLFYESIFSDCNSISFRDTYSKKLFPNLSNIHVFPDIVFQLNKYKSNPAIGSVGLSVIDISNRHSLDVYSELYITFLKNIVKELIRLNRDVYLFSFCQFEGDNNIIKQIVDSEPNVNTVEYNGDIDSFLKVYASMEAVFCTRFHSMVLSLVFNQKLLPIIYSKKMQQVLDDIDFDQKTMNIWDLENSDYLECINSLSTYDFVLSETVRLESVKMFNDFDRYIYS